MNDQANHAYDAEYFNRYAKTQREWESEFRQRRRHYDALLRILSRASPNIRDVVEVGCGVGMLTCAMAAFFGREVRIISGDISEFAVAATRRQLGPTPVDMRLLDAENLDLPDESTDIVTAMDVIEHLQDPERFIAHAYRVLRRQGLLLLSTPNPRSLGGRIKAGRSDAPDELTWFAWRDATHVSVRTIESWRTACRDAGLTKARDGTDLCWDTPYVRSIPTLAQKLVFNGSYRLLMPLIGIVPWSLGENYIGIWRKA